MWINILFDGKFGSREGEINLHLLKHFLAPRNVYVVNFNMKYLFLFVYIINKIEFQVNLVKLPVHNLSFISPFQNMTNNNK